MPGDNFLAILRTDHPPLSSGPIARRWIDCGLSMSIFRAAVVGAGTMGAGIAHAIADAGVPVILTDVDRGSVDAGMAKARSIWAGRVQAGKIDAAEVERRFALIEPATGYEGFGRVDLVIEAVPERMELKQAVFSELDEVTGGQAILASNTSALSITEIAEATTRADRVVGLHFFYPASVARAVEVVEGEYTSGETLQAVSAFVQAIRKLPIRCGEAPGFIVNRILGACWSEAWRYQQATGAGMDEIDSALVEGKASPVGPFALADKLGLDTLALVAEHLAEAYGERFFVHPELTRLAERGDLGVKTGRGFYEHRS